MKLNKKALSALKIASLYLPKMLVRAYQKRCWAFEVIKMTNIDSERFYEWEAYCDCKIIKSPDCINVEITIRAFNDGHRLDCQASRNYFLRLNKRTELIVCDYHHIDGIRIDGKKIKGTVSYDWLDEIFDHAILIYGDFCFSKNGVVKRHFIKRFSVNGVPGLSFKLLKQNEVLILAATSRAR